MYTRPLFGLRTRILFKLRDLLETLVSPSVLVSSRSLEQRSMGNPISKVREEATKADEMEKNKMEERLHILEKMVEGRIASEKTSILDGERNDQEIHSGTIVQTHKQINIWQSEKESQQIKDAISDFFSGDLIGGLEKVVQLGAEAVLGNTSMGEYETSDMFIVWSSDALLRCDAYYYRWNFVAKGVIDEAEGVVGTLLIKRVIDLTKTDPQVLTWAIANQANKSGESEDASQMIDDAMKVLDKVVEFQLKVKELEVGGGGDKGGD